MSDSRTWEVFKAMEEIQLIDSLHPKALPLYINHKWSNEEVHNHYKLKLSEAGDLLERVKRLSKNPDNSPVIDIEI